MSTTDTEKENLIQPLSLSKLATMTVQSANLSLTSSPQLTHLSHNENKASPTILNGNDDPVNSSMAVSNITLIRQPFVADTANSAYDGFTHVLSCPICGFLTLSGSMLQQHAVGHASKSEVVQYSTFTCQKCSCLSTERGIMLEHIKIYHRNAHSPVHLIEEKHTLSVDTNFSDNDVQLNNNNNNNYNKGDIAAYNTTEELSKTNSSFNGCKESPSSSRSVISSNEEDEEVDVVNSNCEKESFRSATMSLINRPDLALTNNTNGTATQCHGYNGDCTTASDIIKKEGQCGSRRRKPNNPGRVLETPSTSSVINAEESVTTKAGNEPPSIILKSPSSHSLEAVLPAKQRRVGADPEPGKISAIHQSLNPVAAVVNPGKSQKIARTRPNRKKQSAMFANSGLLSDASHLPASLPTSPLCLTKSQQPLNLNIDQDCDQAIDMSMKSHSTNSFSKSTTNLMSNMSPVLQFTNLQLPASSQLIEMAARLSPHTLASTMAAMAAVSSSGGSNSLPPTAGPSISTLPPSVQPLQQQQQHVSTDVADVLHRLSAASALFQHLQQTSAIADYSQPKLNLSANGPLPPFRSVSHEPTVTRSSCSSPTEVAACDTVASVFRSAVQPNYELAMDLKMDPSKSSSIVQSSPLSQTNLISTSKMKHSSSGGAAASSKSSKEGNSLSRPHRQNFTPLQNKILTEWYHEHKDKPYPSTEETNLLTKKADLSYPQVKKWFANKRARTSMCIKKPARNNSSSDPGNMNQEDYQGMNKMDDFMKTEGSSDCCSQSSNSVLANENEEDVCKLTNDSASHVSTIFPAFNESVCSPDDRGSEELPSHFSNPAKAF